jgi:hypothetical protein
MKALDKSGVKFFLGSHWVFGMLLDAGWRESMQMRVLIYWASQIYIALIGIYILL